MSVNGRIQQMMGGSDRNPLDFSITMTGHSPNGLPFNQPKQDAPSTVFEDEDLVGYDAAKFEPVWNTLKPKIIDDLKFKIKKSFDYSFPTDNSIIVYINPEEGEYNNLGQDDTIDFTPDGTLILKPQLEDDKYKDIMIQAKFHVKGESDQRTITWVPDVDLNADEFKDIVVNRLIDLAKNLDIL